MDTILTLLLEYRYLLIPAGMWLADIPTLLIVGFLASRGVLDIVPSFFLAVASRLVLELVLFQTGRAGRRWSADRFRSLGERLEQAGNLLERHKSSVLLIYHFIQGTKLAVPVAAGMSFLPSKYFATLNAIGLLIWAAVFISIGWFAHESISNLLISFS